jgi:hypothetical protein
LISEHKQKVNDRDVEHTLRTFSQNVRDDGKIRLQAARFVIASAQMRGTDENEWDARKRLALELAADGEHQVQRDNRIFIVTHSETVFIQEHGYACRMTPKTWLYDMSHPQTNVSGLEIFEAKKHDTYIPRFLKVHPSLSVDDFTQRTQSLCSIITVCLTI